MIRRISQISIGDCRSMGGNVPLVPSHNQSGDLEFAPDAAPAYRDRSREAHLPDRGTPSRRLLNQATMMLIAAGAAALAHADLKPLARPLRLEPTAKHPVPETFPAPLSASVRTRGSKVLPRAFSSKRQRRRWQVIRDPDASWLSPPSRRARTRRGDLLLETPDGPRILLPSRA